MNDYLDSLTDNLTCNLWNIKCKQCVECNGYKNVKSVRIVRSNGVKYINLIKYQMIVKIATKYMKTVNVILNIWPLKKHCVFGYENVKKKILISTTYHISKFPDLFKKKNPSTV